MIQRVHIYTAPGQPATRFRIEFTGRRQWMTYSPHKLLTCVSCHKQRRARNMTVKAYYDTVQFFCKNGCAK